MVHLVCLLRIFQIQWTGPVCRSLTESLTCQSTEVPSSTPGRGDWLVPLGHLSRRQIPTPNFREPFSPYDSTKSSTTSHPLLLYHPSWVLYLTGFSPRLSCVTNTPRDPRMFRPRTLVSPHFLSVKYDSVDVSNPALDEYVTVLGVRYRPSS